MTDESLVICRVDGCSRRAASVVSDDLPGPIQLCATHTEDFRMNGAAWTVTWNADGSRPTSVRAAPAGLVGRGPLASVGDPALRESGWAKLKTRLSERREPRP